MRRLAPSATVACWAGTAQRRHSKPNYHASARDSKSTSHNPLRKRDPGSRSVAIPDAFHDRVKREERLSYAQRTNAAKSSALKHYAAAMLWTGTSVDSTDHWLVAHFMKLRKDPQFRDARGMLVLGSSKILQEMAENDQHPEYLLVKGGKEVPGWANRDRTEVVGVEPSVFSEAFPDSDGFVGNYDLPDIPMAEELIASPRQLRNVVVLDNVDDPGLLGSTLRTAASMAYDAVLLTNHCADIFDTRVVSAARGAHFQKLTKFYALREENGDDAIAMLDHVARRNDLTVAAFSPKSKAEQRTDADWPLPRTEMPEVQRRSLHSFCVDEYTRRAAAKRTSPLPSDGAAPPLRPGTMLVMGPDHKGTLLERTRRTVRRPVTCLELDAPVQQMAIAAPLLLYQLRESAEQDYLTPAQRAADRHLAAASAAQMSSMRVQLGPDLKDMGTHLINQTEEEYAYETRMYHQGRRLQRMAGYNQSDEANWVDLQLARIHAKRGKPRDSPLNSKDRYPDLIHEAHEEGLDRESLREAEKWAQAYTPPANYDSKFAPPTGKVRRHRVVAH